MGGGLMGASASMAKGGCAVFRKTTQHEYQRWTDYPDSPMLSEDFPYQAVVRAWHLGSDFVTVLFGCKGQLGTYSNFGTLVLYDTGYDGSDRPIAYTYTDGVWVPYRTPRPSDIIMGQISYLIWPEYYEANYDILGGIAKTTTSDQDGRVGRFRVSSDFINSQNVSGYQKWTNYPDSPFLSSEFPHQVIAYTNYHNDSMRKLYLILSDTGDIYHHVLNTYGNVLRTRYWTPTGENFTLCELIDNAWVVEGVTSNLNLGWATELILESNCDIYTDDTFDSVYFDKTTTPEQDGNGLPNIRAKAAFWAGKIEAATDFFNIVENPHGRWAYGLKTTKTGSLVLYDTIYDTGEPGVKGWTKYPWNSGNLWKNTTSTSQYEVLPNQISFHPGSSGQWSVIRWTAPSSRSIRMYGYFGKGDLGPMTYSILQNNSTLLFDKYQVGTTENFDISTFVSDGDTIDFQIGDLFMFGNTPVDINILGAGGGVVLKTHLFRVNA
jgi:hypothetical protein